MRDWQMLHTKIALRSWTTRTLLILMVVVLSFAVLAPTDAFADPKCSTDDSSSSSSTSTPQGLSDCQKDLYTSGVFTFDVNDGAQICSATGDESLVGNDKVSQIMNYFVGQGLTAPQAAGITGNIQSESAGTFNPRIVQGGSFADSPTPNVGYGLVQWTTAGRQQGLKDFAAKEGLPVSSMKLQLDYIWQELNTGYKDSTLTPLQNADSAQQAAVIFMVNYEAPKDHDPNGPNAQARSKNAANALAAYGASTGGTTTPAPTDTTTDTTSGCSDGTNSGDTTAVAGQGFVGNCDGQGSFASIVCGQCVDYVKWVMRNHYPPYQGEATGNGVDVAKHLADTYHVPLNHTPAVHSIVSWGRPFTSGSAGHVALVSQVNTNAQNQVTSIVVEDSNYSSPPDERYRKRTITDLHMINGGTYAHIEGGWK
jgi:surface antigen